MTREQAAEASATFVRSLDPDARRLFEAPGPRDTDIHRLEGWAVQMPEDRPRVVIIQILGARMDQHSGWLIFAEIGPNDIPGTRRAMLAIGRMEKDA